MEISELPRDVHPFFVASQFHPGVQVPPDRPAPLFREFVGAAYARHGGTPKVVEPVRAGEVTATRLSD